MYTIFFIYTFAQWLAGWLGLLVWSVCNLCVVTCLLLIFMRSTVVKYITSLTMRLFKLHMLTIRKCVCACMCVGRVCVCVCVGAHKRRKWQRKTSEKKSQVFMFAVVWEWELCFAKEYFHVWIKLPWCVSPEGARASPPPPPPSHMWWYVLPFALSLKRKRWNERVACFNEIKWTTHLHLPFACILCRHIFAFIHVNSHILRFAFSLSLHFHNGRVKRQRK